MLLSFLLSMKMNFCFVGKSIAEHTAPNSQSYTAENVIDGDTNTDFCSSAVSLQIAMLISVDVVFTEFLSFKTK